MRILLSLLGGPLIAFVGFAYPAHADNKVIVHEWGTFTCLQDEEGQAIGGINVDDEPVPWFVWQYANRTVADQYSSDQKSFGLPPYGADGKGWTAGDPNVTVRLETPVIYIYPPLGRMPQSVPPLDVHVDFHGGVLSQYYPYASTNGASLNGDTPYLQPEVTISNFLTTGLTWKNVQLGGSDKLIATNDKELEQTPWMRGQPVETDDKVWTTPREVSAPLLQVKFATPDYGHPGKRHQCVQTEHFLFYRGVGQFNSPLCIQTGAGNGQRHMRLQWATGSRGEPFPGGWLVQIRADGSCAYYLLDHPEPDPISWGMATFYDGLPGSFTSSDFKPDNLAKLKASMQEALVKEGLYPDEASAMLRTWELSYFKSPGLRFFYIVPRQWVDEVLPLKITGAPTEITRVMIGRIEMVTDQQHAALERLAKGPCPDLPAFKKAAQQALENKKLPQAEANAFYRGEKPLSALGIPIPLLIQDYLSLGRFRDALVMDEYRKWSKSALLQFIQENQIGLEGYKPHKFLSDQVLRLREPSQWDR